MRGPRFAIVLLLAPACRPATTPVTYTSNALTEAVCSSLASSNQGQTKPVKVTVSALTIMAVRQGALVNVTPISGKGQDEPKRSATVTIEVDPSTIKCEASRGAAPRMWLDTESGVLVGAPSE
jgi:hypothetical protein